MNITAEEVKKLREKTGAGMMDCKKALKEAKGSMDQAAELLRKWGISTAAKRAGRTASDGIIGHFQDTLSGVLVEVNCETDFVAKTNDFQNYVKTITELIRKGKPADLNALLNMEHDGTTIGQFETNLNAKIGEKLGVRRFVCWQTGDKRQKLVQYIHAGSKIGVMISFDDPDSKLNGTFGREIAMHIAAMNPSYIRKNDVPPAVIEKEKEILSASPDIAKKPPEIQEKIVTGKLARFYSEVCLENQIFVRDPEGKTTVGQALAKIDPKIKIDKFVRFQVGEGMEKK